MKYLVVILGMVLSLSIQAQVLPGSETIELVKGLFSEEGCEYFLCSSESNEKGHWMFFVNPKPLSGWEHEAYKVEVGYSYMGPLRSNEISIPDSTLIANEDNRLPLYEILGIDTIHMPPNDILIPLDLPRTNNDSFLPPMLNSNLINALVNESNKCDTYAIILSGGGNKNSNYERYWNDCSFIYQTLTKSYAIPKSRIFPIMSDGNNPEADMFTYDYKYISSPLDLDSDGLDELELSATKNNVKSTLDKIKSSIKWGDQLFIYVIDHGGTRDYNSKSYICLWNNEVLHDYELAEYLKEFTSAGIIVNVVLGQCFAGGFIDDLNEAGCVVAAACRGNESSYACGTIPYDEFVYRWTTALNGKYPYDTELIEADTDNNGIVTMKEAFEFALKHDQAYETPQFLSNPAHLGNELTFISTPKPVELYIRDDYNDVGSEPNDIEVTWNSPDIWIRNNDDGIEWHENPEYSPTHLAVMINTRIHNRGWMPYNSDDHYLHNYWAWASTGLTKTAWNGRELYENEFITGDHLRANKIRGPISAGESLKMKTTWALPNDIYESTDVESVSKEDQHHFCILSRVLPYSFDDYFSQGTEVMYDVRGDRTIAQKNMTIIRRNSQFNMNGINLFIRNVYSQNHQYSLEVRPHSFNDSRLFSVAQVSITMSQPIFNSWNCGGMQSNDVYYNFDSQPNTVYLSSENSSVQGISMGESEFDLVSLHCNFHTESVIDNNYSFDLIQRDENGRIIGGETIVIEPLVQISEDQIVADTTKLDPYIPNLENLKALSKSSSQNELKAWNYRIFDNDNRFIGIYNSYADMKSAYIKYNNDKYRVVAVSSDGEFANISTDFAGIKPIKRIVKNGNLINIEFNNSFVKSNDVIFIYPVLSGVYTSKSINLEKNQNSMQINAMDYPQGIYILQYVKNGEVIETTKIQL